DFINIYISLLNSLDYLQYNGIIHNDIKPTNIMIPNKNNLSNVILLDYGLSSKNNTYFDKFIGTVLYCSINAHRQTTLNYKDDIESLCFNLLYWITKRLPWKGKKEKILYYKIKFKNNYSLYIKKMISSLNLNNSIQVINYLNKMFSYMFSLNK